MSLTTDGRTFAYGMGNMEDPSYPDRVRVWDVPRHQVISTFTMTKAGPDSGLTGMLLSPDGADLMTTEAYRRGVTVRDVRHRKTLRTLRYAGDSTNGPGGNLRAVRPDGRLLLTNTGTTISSPSGKEAHGAFGDADVSAFSPDGRYVAVDEGDGRVALWDGELRQRLGVLSGSFSSGRLEDFEQVSALAFSHDGSTLAVAGSRGTVQLWDVAAHQTLGSSMPTPGDGILSVAFSPDDTAVYAAGEHVPWQKYVIDPKQVVGAACARAGAPLSPADWKIYLPEVPYRRTCRSEGRAGL
jgi:WD40 repeat protein